jgi:hypothetical protein
VDARGGRSLLGKVRRLAEGDDPAPVDERHPVAEPLCLLYEMGDQHDRHPAVAHAFDQAPRLRARFGIEPARAGCGRSWSLAQVTADTDLVTLQLRIATGGGHILTAQEAAHHQ